MTSLHLNFQMNTLMATCLDFLKITLGVQNRNITAAGANNAHSPCSLSLIPSPSWNGKLGEVSKILPLQEKEGSTVYIPTAQERKTVLSLSPLYKQRLSF